MRWASIATVMICALGASGCTDGLNFGIGGCEGGPMGGGSPPPPFVATEINTVPAAVETTVTAAGTAFLVAQREALVGLLFDVGDDGWVNLALPEIAFGSNSLGGGVRNLVIGFDLRVAQIGLEFLPDPTRVRLSIERARLKMTSGEVWLSVGGDAACGLGNGLDPGTRDEALLDATFSVDIFLEVDDQGRFQARVEVLPFTIFGLNFELIYDPELPECADGVTATECRLVCTAGDTAIELIEALYDVFRDRIHEAAQPAIEGLVNSMLEDFTDQPLFIEGSLHPRVLSDLLPTASDAHPIGFKLAPSPMGFSVRSAGDAGDGVALTMDVGLDSVDHPCVPLVNAPPPFQSGPPPVLTGFDHAGAPYHLGTSLSDAVVNRAVWAAYRGGALCVAMDSGQLAELLGQQVTTDSLSLVLPGLRELSLGPKPILVALDPKFKPEDFPLATFFDVDDDGGIPQAGIGINMPNLGLSFYALIEERWTRLFSAQISIGLDVVVQATPDNRIALAIQPPRIGDLREGYNELLEGANIEPLLNLVIDLATSALLRDDVALDLPLTGLVSQFTGLPLDVKIAAIRTDGTNGDFLSTLLSLVPAAPGQAAGVAAETTAEVAGFDGARGELILQVESPGADEALFQWQLDGGPWRPLTRAEAGQLVLREPRLQLIGEHIISTRSVWAGDYESLDPTPAVVSVETLEPVPAARPANAPDRPQPAASPKAGCDARGLGGGGGAALGLLLLLPLLGRKRRNLMVVLSLLGLVFALGGCSDKKAASDAQCETTAECPGGLSCFDGVCVKPNPCGSSEECCPGETCNGGACEADPGLGCVIDADCFGGAHRCEAERCVRIDCTDSTACPAEHQCIGGYCHRDPPCGARCGPEQACYANIDQCRAAPPSCVEGCGPGTVRVVRDPATYTGVLCDLSDARCECVEVPAISPADFGRHASMAVVFDEVFFAAWDADFGDLVFIEGIETAAPKITYLDGQDPNSPVVADPRGVRGGRTAPGPDRGRYASLDLDPKGRPHIAYYDADATSLRYIRRLDDGTWAEPIVLDDAGDAGRYPVLRIDSAGWPRIIYHVRSDDGRVGVRFAYANSPEPGSSDFVVREISMRPAPVDELVPPPPGVTPRAHGVMPCMDIGVDGRVHAAFYDGEERWLYRAVGGPDGFAVGRVSGLRADSWPADPGGRYARFETHDLGRYCSIVVGADLEEHIALADFDTNALLYFHAPAEAPGLFEMIDPGQAGVRRFVGADPVLKIDGEGNLVVVYQDATENDLLMSVRKAEGWSLSPVVVASAGAVGFYNGLEITQQEAIVGTLELKTTASGRGDHALRVYRVDVPRF